MGAKKQLEWSLFAERGLVAIYDFIATDNPSAAENVVRHLLVEAAGLTAFPMVGHEGKRAGTRELVTPTPLSTV